MAIIGRAIVAHILRALHRSEVGVNCGVETARRCVCVGIILVPPFLLDLLIDCIVHLPVYILDPSLHGCTAEDGDLLSKVAISCFALYLT